MAIASEANDRKPIIWAVSVSKLKQLFQDVIPSYAAQAEIHIIDKGFDEALASVRARMQAEEVDVLVAAGSNGTYLRQHVSLPVVMVKVSGFDMLDALTKARKISERIAIVTHQTITPELRQFKHLFNLAIEQRSYTTEENARQCVSDLAASGIEVIVGPGMVTELAQAAGLTGIFLYSQNSVHDALDDAIEVARVAHIEEARREHLNTILRHLNEGVVAVDMEQRVQSINPVMERLLGVEAGTALGRHWSDIAPTLTMRRTLHKGVTDLEEIERIGNRTVVTNRIPIIEQGLQTGAVLTLQDSTAIQRVDRNLRSQNRPRHFVAKYELSKMLGASPAIKRTLDLARKYAKTEASVLITGESGTGKELLAQGMHNASRRRHYPFVAINCGAFPEALLESELFGYEEGAFTGSRKGGKIGLIESAHTGTLFLDEVGEMPLALQTRLLRVLQEKEVLRLGSTDSVPVDARIFAASNRNLHELVAQRAFRADLFYRLNILHIDLPPLREHPEDLSIIAAHLLEAALRRLGSKRSVSRLLGSLLPFFRAHSWPGNVRELENIIERIVVFCCDSDPHSTLGEAELRAMVPEIFESTRAPTNGGELLKAVNRGAELTHILNTIDNCGGNQAEACRRLGIGRTTLWRKLKATDPVS
jgi:transcriptional regulator, propionate catabolism operon regulatory protein